MSNPRAIRPQHGPASDSGGLQTWASRFALPHDLVLQARRRLGYLAATFCGLAIVMGPVALKLSDSPQAHTLGPIMVAGTALVSFALFCATRLSRLSNAAVLVFGLVYEILMCLSSSTLGVLDVYKHTGHIPEVTFACVLIAVYPLIVPGTPWITLVASSIAATMAPLGLGILVWSGAIDAPPFEDVIAVSMGPLAAVILAVMGSRVIHQIGTELVKARKLGSYTLEELLGHGGMGEVWRARHRLLSRPAAIKLIKPEALGEDPARADALIKRFKLEAQTTASLRSAHTVELYDFGTTPEGTFYYVMELLEGVDLEGLVKQHGPMPAARVVHLLRQVCHSLDEAHARGLVHRDIKPSNIFVGRYGRDTDFVKVLDFGLVKRSNPTEANLESNLTQFGNVVGTPAFIAPEMVMSGLEIDSRVDIYALGCVAYWLLTGSHVFPTGTAMEAAIHHVKDQPQAPSSVTELHISEALDAIVLSCLEKDPDNRPRSAKDLSERLQALEFDSPWTEADAGTWWDRTYPKPAAP